MKNKELTLVPIDCIRCFGIYTYELPERLASSRRLCTNGNVCNTCLKPKEKEEMANILECTMEELFGPKKKDN